MCRTLAHSGPWGVMIMVQLKPPILHHHHHHHRVRPERNSGVFFFFLLWIKLLNIKLDFYTNIFRFCTTFGQEHTIVQCPSSANTSEKVQSKEQDSPRLEIRGQICWIESLKMEPTWGQEEVISSRLRILSVSHTNRPSAERVDVLFVSFMLELLLDVPQRKQRQ